MGQVAEYMPPAEKSVVVTAVHNALEPLASRVTRSFAPGKTPHEYVCQVWPLSQFGDRSLVAVINGVGYHWGDCPQVPLRAGDSLVFLLAPGKGGGGGKNPVMMVAMIALTVVTGGGAMGGFLAESLATYSLETAIAMDMAIGSGIGLSLATSLGIAATLVGGAVMSAVMSGLPSGDGANSASASLDQSATYSWGLSNNPVVEGGPVPFIFGTVRITPPCIGRYVVDADTTDADNKNQYLVLLYLVADHQVDSITNVWLNGNPSTFYTDVTIETRLGTNDQTAIPFFRDTVSQKGSGAVLSASGWVSCRTDGNAVQGLGVCFANDGGLFHAVGASTENTSVTIRAQYRKVGSSTWLPFFDNGTSETKTITGNSTSPLFHYYRLDNLPDGAGQYEVQAQYVSAPSTDVSYKNRTVLSYIHEIVYDAFSYPGRALLAVKIKATDQLSGSTPSVSCLVTRSTVSVSDGTTTYDKAANNPAWAALDLLQNVFYGAQVSPSRCIWADFDAWASWCPTKGYTVNYYADTIQGLPRQLLNVAVQGRAAVVQVGSQFTCVVDKPTALPVQGFMFNVSNMHSFSEAWAAREGLANSIEVTYFDAQADYSRQVAEVHALEYDTSDLEIIKQSVALPGCTDRAQATAYAQFLINCNRYLTNTITFVADIDSLACTVGDVINVQHDVPQWGYGGRVVSASATQLVLDKSVPMVLGGTYAVQLKHAADDTRSDVYVQTVPGETNTLTIVGSWPGATPVADDLYNFGPVGSVSKNFRIVSMLRNGDLQRKIVALEYDPRVYDDGTVIPSAENQSLLPTVYSLLAAESFDVVNGQPVARMNLGWKGASLSWDVSYRAQGQSIWQSRGRVTYPGDVIPGTELVPGVVYEFRVVAGNTELTTSCLFQGGPTPPDITGLFAYMDGAGALFLAYNPADCPWSVDYEVRKGPAWATAQVHYFGPSTTVQLNGPGTYWVAAKFGQLHSASPASLLVTDSPVVQNVIAVEDEAATGWTGTRDAGLYVVGDELWLLGDGDIYVDVPDVYALGDVYTIGGTGLVGTYQIPTGHRVELSQSASCNVIVNYTLRGEGVYDDVYDDPDFWAVADVYGGFGSKVSAVVEIRTYNGSTWSAWSEYRPGFYSGQKYDARVTLYSTVPSVLAILSEFTLSVDVPDRVDWHKGVWVPDTGLNFTHAAPFNAVPSTVVQILSATPGDDDVLTNETVSGGTLFIYNGGVAVGRYVNLIHQGY